MKRFFLITFLIVGQVMNGLCAPADVAAEIKYLLTSVENSKGKFIRNGDEHSGKDAAGHMKKKYDHFKKQIKTAEDFVEKCATKSELSGKVYKIKEADGTMVDSKAWMLARLAEYRKQAN
jgi:hypothetical protein